MSQMYLVGRGLTGALNSSMAPIHPHATLPCPAPWLFFESTELSFGKALRREGCESRQSIPFSSQWSNAFKGSHAGGNPTLTENLSGEIYVLRALWKVAKGKNFNLTSGISRSAKAPKTVNSDTSYGKTGMSFFATIWARSGYSKHVYQEMPQSSAKVDLEKNVIAALDAIPLKSIQRDAYQQGLLGKQDAWAAKKYHGHRVLPNSILEELDHNGIT
ncbi:hypothetical protein C8Q74DRAFT_1434092 [Fomes fomentarius]|nr:hypothetical protein C8Q74DRAFT_1434092 [Fomes fomentarius]